MTIPRKPWHIRYEGSANSLRDADGGLLAYVPSVAVAEEIVRCVNELEKGMEELESRLDAEHDAAIGKLEDRIDELEDWIDELIEELREAKNV